MTVIAATEAEQAVALLRSAVEALDALDLSRLANDELLALLRGVEKQQRSLGAVDASVVAELDARGVAGEQACSDTATLLSLALRIDRREASRRVRAARELGPRRATTGAQLPPEFPHVTQACAVGEVSTQHAGVITRCVRDLPADVRAARGDEIERYLVDQARVFCPADLQIVTRRLKETYDQDGRLAADADADAEAERRRYLTAHRHADGSVSGRYRTDAVCGEALLSFLDSAAQPVPGPGGEPDPRTPTQRRHDALRDGLLAVLRSGTLPDTGGISTTIVLTMTPDQVAAARGGDVEPHSRLVPTGHGALMGLDATRSLLGDAQVQPVLVNSLRAIEAYGHTHRIFTAGQRLAMIARDHGCSFPGCTVGPAWCEAHHVEPFVLGGKTSVDNGTLLCGYHHAHFERLGFECTMIDGHPHWIPPRWIDAGRTPIRNTAHLPGPEPPRD